MLLFLASLAHAGLRADLTTLAQEPADVRMACSSADAALAWGGRLVEGFASVADEGDAVSETTRAVAAVRAANLFAPGARLQVLVGAESSEVRFETAHDAATLARALAAVIPETAAVEDADGWILTKVDDPSLRVSVSNGRASLRIPRDAASAALAGAAALAAGPRMIPPAILEAVPDDNGCLVHATRAQPQVGDTDAVFHLSFEKGQPARFAATSTALAAVPGAMSLVGTGAVPPDVRTEADPIGIFVLGLGVQDFDASALPKKDAAKLRKLRRYLPVAGGTTVALLSVAPPMLAAVVPMERPIKARPLARRVARVLKKSGATVEKVDATHLTVSTPMLPLNVATVDGRVNLATDPTLLRAMDRNAGELWADETTRALVGAFPFVVSLGALPGAAPGALTRLAEPITFAMGVDSAALRGEVRVPVPPAELASMMKSLNSKDDAPEAPVDPSGASASPDSSSDAETAATALIAQVNDARRRGDWDAARAGLADLATRYPDTRAAETAARIGPEIALIGTAATPVEAASWYTRPAKLTDARTTILVFWEEWCPHCKSEMPKMPGLAARHKAEGVQVIALTKVTRTSTDDSVKAFIKANGLTDIAIGREKDGAMSAAYAVEGIPAAAVVRDGKVIWRGHPAMLTDERVTRLATE